MRFLRINGTGTFLNISAIETVEFDKRARTETLKPRGLGDIAVPMAEELVGAVVITVNGSRIKIDDETARQLQYVVEKA